MMSTLRFGIVIVAVWAMGTVNPQVGAAELGSEFTYQAQLKLGGVPLNDTADFEFSLWDDAGAGQPPVGGNQIGNTQTVINVTVVDGLFTVQLNGAGEFGADAFIGDKRFIEIAVRSPAGGGAFTTLDPRQPLTATPYALQTRGIFVDDAGKVGIGTTSPQSALTINHAGLAGLILERDQGFFADTTMQMQISSNAGPPGLRVLMSSDNGASFADAVFITETTEVGIGTQSPSEKLHVVGNIHASGTIQSGSSITIDGTAGSEHIASSGALELHAGGDRALRLESVGPNSSGNNQVSSNVIGGWSGNTVTAEVVGATISGGGYDDLDAGQDAQPNRVTNDFGTVSGGFDNTASGIRSTVGGGSSNNALGSGSTVGGGTGNTASGDFSSTVSGGAGNTAGGFSACVPGGSSNTAGGWSSFAAGHRAKVRTQVQVGGTDLDGDEGTFVWADFTNEDFTSTGPNQFLIRATGGVGIGTPSPLAGFQLDVNGNIRCAVLLETSSRALKQDIIPIDNALESLSRLQGVRFRWTEEHGGQPDLGFVAEDVAEVFPELVTWEREGVKASGLKYGHLTAVAVEAIKELSVDVKAQEDQVADLTARLERMEAMMSKLLTPDE